MSTPEFEVHRAIVHYSNPSTGEGKVRLPSLLGAGQVVDVPTTGLTFADGTWNVPQVGASVFIAVSSDRTQFLWLAAVATLSDGSTFVRKSGDTMTGDLIVNADITTNNLQFDLANGAVTGEGQVAWNEDEGTLDVGLHGGNVTLQTGQEVVYYAKNQTGVTIPDGTVVRFDGTVGNSGRLKIAPFLADKTYKSAYVMGVTTEDILNGEDGYVTHFGKVRGLDTTTDSEGHTLSDGDLLYASATVPGGYTNVDPGAPNNRVLLAAVIHAHSNGTLFVRPTMVADLLDNERVNAPAVGDGEVLVYNTATSVFESGDHGDLAGLSDDDHTQYLRTDGTLRTTSALKVDGNVETTAGNLVLNDITVERNASNEMRLSVTNSADATNDWLRVVADTANELKLVGSPNDLNIRNSLTGGESVILNAAGTGSVDVGVDGSTVASFSADTFNVVKRITTGPVSSTNGHPYWSVHRTTTQTIATNSITPIGFNVESADPASVHTNSTTGTTGGRVLIRYDGIYTISWSAHWDNTATAGQRQVIICTTPNSTWAIPSSNTTDTTTDPCTLAVSSSGPRSSAGYIALTTSWTGRLYTNTYVWGAVYQNTGGNLTFGLANRRELCTFTGALLYAV